MTLPLSGLLVVSLEQAVAAPMCTCRLADAGARVIKIERPEGDFARSYDDFAHGESSYFVWLNRGKESVVLDLAKAGDKALLEAMLGRADIFVQNLKPGTVGKLGFPIARLRHDYPRLICCSISGFGESGPFAGRKGLRSAHSGRSRPCLDHRHDGAIARRRVGRRRHHRTECVRGDPGSSVGAAAQWRGCRAFGIAIRRHG
jgi:crotonobetainyl-CoA:carnitine CoA-transferase CaiB-like acyl-CoA transferase